MHRSQRINEKSPIKRYDVERCSWQTVLSSHEGCRDNACVVAAGNPLYICGGSLGGEYFFRAERFDTCKKQMGGNRKHATTETVRFRCGN